MKRDNYSIDDFILNESFQRYAINPTPEEVDYWESWVKERPEHIELFERSKEIIRFIATRRTKPKHLELSEEVFRKLQGQIRAEARQQTMAGATFKIKYYWYAASILLVIGLGIVFSLRLRKQDTEIAGRFLEVIVPEGQRSQLLLPDGTQVWLNAGTHFKYPSEFLKEKRDVFVEGEAFFKVAHNAKKPFIVHMRENLSVRVLGTEFNVKCYASDNIIETTLVKGSIRLIQQDDKNNIIRELRLKPNEKASYEKSNKHIEIANLTVPKAEQEGNEIKAPVSVERMESKQPEMEAITAWKDDALVFQDETFSDIAVKMERWFGMHIIIDDEMLKTEKFTGKFVNKETIYQILDIFNRSESIQYTTKNKDIIITKRKK